MKKTYLRFLPLVALVAIYACSASPKKEYPVEKPSAEDSASATVKANTKPKDDPFALITCSSESENRTLSVATKDQGCELNYEKNGKIKVVAYTAYGTAHCINARDKMRKKLETAGWKCQ